MEGLNRGWGYDAFHVVAEIDALALEVYGQVRLIQDLGQRDFNGSIGFHTSFVLSLFFEGKLVDLRLVYHQQRKRLNNDICTFSPYDS